MGTFSENTRNLAISASNGFCMCSKDCAERADAFHHKLSNTKINQKRFPLFIQSIFNCCPVNNIKCHLNKPMPKIGLMQAEAYERWLESFQKGEM